MATGPNGGMSSLGRMFTGIVRERGVVAALDGDETGRGLVIEGPETAAVTAIGDSVSIDGVDLTATEIVDGRMRFHAVPETLARTTIGNLQPGSEVNLEPALRAGEPFGGHYVQGHVDGVGEVRAVEHEGEGLRVWIEAPADLMRYIVEKGSIAVHGVSLTVADLGDDAFAVALIPHTLAETTLGTLAIGDRFNLEVDVLGKYVERMLTRRLRST
jgi:riboflavin synthase alpha subunit